MNPNNYRYDLRFLIGLIAVIVGAGFFIYNLVWTVETKLGSVEGALELFCSLLGAWSIANIVGNYFSKRPIRTRLAKNDIQFAIALLMAIAILLISNVSK